ncbi:hypothetical protein C8J56DRAFT_314028 [Mycena floridula]|nr:hypothetical protein C8J56DRAFT_314028 [Mycena floridula]
MPISTCRVCETEPSKYTCSRCPVVYCSVACYKKHKGKPLPTISKGNPIHFKDDCSGPSSSTLSENPDPARTVNDPQRSPKPLTSLRWPYVPERPAYPDPLQRDDPKPLQLSQYEAIATSPAIRSTLETYPDLRPLLISLDNLRGLERETALRQALGATAIEDHSTELSDNVLAFRALAAAIENAVREGPLGLDWEAD